MKNKWPPLRSTVNRVGLPILVIILTAIFFSSQALAQSGPHAPDAGNHGLTPEQMSNLCQNRGCAIQIPLQEHGGVWALPVKINGVITLNFILDSGAAEVAIPADVVMTLIRAGTIIDSDFLPGKTYQTADGSKLKSERFTLHEMEFGGIRIANVPCSVTPPAGDLLLGQSLLGRLDSWSLENKKHVLIVGNVKEGDGLKLNLANLPPGTTLTFGGEKDEGGARPSPATSLPPKLTSTDSSQGSADTNHATSAFARGDYAEAYDKFRFLAERGNAIAQRSLGYMYEYGEGVPQNYEVAANLFRKAAEQGDAIGQRFLGMAYFGGNGVPKDYAEGFKWSLRAAEQGDVIGQSMVGNGYLNGSGIAQDYAEAFRWSHKAAEQGETVAQLNLGVMYHNGKGVPQDYTEAVKWYRKAAAKGYSLAECKLGLMYQLGQGVPQDDVEAVKLYRMAAEQGDATGQSLLAVMYFEGKGVPQNLVLAYMWVNLAAVNGNPACEKMREDLVRRMTPSQLDEAQRLTRKWRPKSRTAVSENSKISTASPVKWLVILGSDRLENREKSEERLASIKPHAPAARIVNSGTYPRLLAGLWVVVEGPFNKITAKREKARLLPVVPDVFIRAGW